MQNAMTLQSVRPATHLPIPMPRPGASVPESLQAGSRGIWKDTRSKPLAA